jgi:ribosome-binding factor A
MSADRVSRVEDFIRREISTIILNQVNDIRFKDFNITAVRCSSDLSSAKIFYKQINFNKQEQISALALKKFTSLVRSKLAKSITMKRVPTLTFFEDQALDNYSKITGLLDSIND